jgi:hypothetical protein
MLMARMNQATLSTKRGEKYHVKTSIRILDVAQNFVTAGAQTCDDQTTTFAISIKTRLLMIFIVRTHLAHVIE